MSGPGYLPDAKVEKLKEGKEKIKVGSKEYKATWTTYKIKASAGREGDIDSNVKVWVVKEIPLGVAKMERTMSIGGRT